MDLVERRIRELRVTKEAPLRRTDAGVNDVYWWCEVPGADVRVVTSGGKGIPAHSRVLASASPVLESILFDRPRKRGGAGNVVPILGVPCDAVVVFLRCLYSSRCAGDEMEKYGVHLLVLSHAMRVPWLKRAAEAGLSRGLLAESVVDMLKLARQCDAPRLYVRCLNLVRAEREAVERTEGWKFLRRHDRRLEHEVLRFLDEADKRERRRVRTKEQQRVYAELSEAMECLQHICAEGCNSFGPRDQPILAVDGQRQGPCRWASTCEGLQALIRHFAACTTKRRKPQYQQRAAGGGCGRCTRMLQLLRLHSVICDQPETCKVHLCQEFKKRTDVAGKKGEEEQRWMLLARKVVSAKVFSTLSKRKREH